MLYPRGIALYYIVVMLLKKIRRWALVSAAVFVSAYGVLLATPSVVSADGRDGSFIEQSANGKVLDHQLYYYMISCFRGTGIDEVTTDEVNEWRWFWGSDNSRYRGGMYENNYVSCSDGKYLGEAFGRFGFTDPLDTYCSLDFAYNSSTGGLGKNVNGGNTKEACKNGAGVDGFDGSDGSGEKDFQGDSVDKLLATSTKFNEAKGALAKYAEYIRYYRTFMRACDVSLTQPYTEGAGKGDKAYQVRVVNQNGDTEDWLGAGGKSSNMSVTLVSTTGSQPKNITCGELVEGIRALAGDYSEYLGSFDATDPPVDAGGGNNGADAPVCSAGALGWVLCPLSEAMVGAIGSIAEFLEPFLIFDPLTTSDQGKAIKAIWGSLLGIANAGLIIAFLIIVFSQATSVGLSNYGIKKLLPRVIAAAILMNLSFYICAIAVDLSNILGVSVKSIIDSGIDQVAAAANNPDLRASAGAGEKFATITGGVLVAGIAVGTGAIFLLIPLLMSALMAILTAFLILAARQVLITLLIIVAPLAILAWILPNTEGWFTKWRKLFTILLLMFPMIMAIFYGAILVSSVILASAGSGSARAADGFTIQILAFIVLFVPLFALPFVIKSVGGILERFGAIVNNKEKGLVDRSRKKAEELKGRSPYQQFKPVRKQAREDLRRQRTAKRLARAYNPNEKSSLIDNYRRTQAGGAVELTKIASETEIAQKAKAGASKVATKGVAGLYGISPAAGDMGAQIVAGTVNAANNLPGREMRSVQREALMRSATAQVNKAFEQAVADVEETQKNFSSDRREAIAQGTEPASVESQVASARWVMANGNFAQRQSLYETIGTNSSEQLRQTISTQYFAKGDNKIIGASWGGKLLDGSSGGAAGLRSSTAENIKAQKVTPQAMIHDADATELLLQVGSAASTYGINSAAIDSLRASAVEALNNESTKTTATAGIYKTKIEGIKGL